MGLKPKTGTKGGARKGAPRRSDKSDDKITDDDLKELVPSGIQQGFLKSKLHDKALAVAGLGAPPDWDGDMPELPNDVAGVDHDELSNLLAQFTNAHSSSLWTASKHYVEADAYEEIADYLKNQALLDSDQSNDTKRRADAETNEAYLAAESMRRQHYRDYVRHRDLAHTLKLRGDRVSRIGGFVGDEAEMEDNKAGKSSTRGKSLGSSRGKGKGTSKARSRR